MSDNLFGEKEYSDNSRLLENWLVTVLAENPDIIRESKRAVEIYSCLYEVWVSDIQRAMKSFALEVKKGAKK